MAKVLAELNEVFREVFGEDDIVIDRGTTASDIEGWDSLMHVTLIIHVETAFGIRFSSAEVAMLENVGELEDIVTSRLEAR